MQDNEEQEEERGTEDTAPIQAFAGSEMLDCPKCGRKNPPNRPSCLYCGAAVEAPADLRSRYWPVVREAEPWESGFSVILTEAPGGEAKSLESELAAGLGFDPDLVAELLSAGEALPVARVASRTEAEAVASRLEVLGVSAFVLPDEDLCLRDPQVRLKGLGFRDGLIVPTTFSGAPAPPAFAPLMFVEGYIVRKTLESSEGRKRQAGKITDAVETGSDERLIDIYGPDGIVGFRIRTDGFDFSVLGNKKAYTANENIGILADELRDRFPDAVFDRGYKRLRRALGVCWPTTESVSSEGVQRKSFGGYTKKRAHSTSNEEQFLRYSRMRRFLRTENE